MYEEKQTISLPFAVDRKESARQCGLYVLLFGAMMAVLVYAMVYQSYTTEKMALILAAYLVIALATWLPMVLRCVTRLHLEAGGVRLTVLGLTVRWYPVEKIRFLTAMECSGKNRTASRSQILLCVYTFEELAAMGGRKPGNRKSAAECARQYLNRYANAYYLRELNLTRRILWLDWSPERIRLLRWMYPDAKWADFSHKHMFDKQMND